MYVCVCSRVCVCVLCACVCVRVQYIYYDPVLAYVAEGQSPLLPVWTVQACDPDGINNTIYYYFIGWLYISVSNLVLTSLAQCKY